MSDIYYSPEKYGLETLAVLDDPNSSYSFDMVVVWTRLEDGKLFWAGDSGCSCPSPFESYDLSNINPINDWEQLRDLGAASWNRKHWDYMSKDDPEQVHFYGADRMEFAAKVTDAFKAWEKSR